MFRIDTQETDIKETKKYYARLKREIEKRVEKGGNGAEWLPGGKALMYLASVVPDEEKDGLLATLRKMDNDRAATEVYVRASEYMLKKTQNKTLGKFSAAEILRQEDYREDGRFEKYMASKIPGWYPGWPE